MNLVLAVEPDGKQAECLRQLLGEQGGAQLVLVTSAYGAAVLMNQRVPDLVLLGASLDQKAREHVVDHFILASDVPEPQSLGIPPLIDTDPDAFQAAIAASLARADQQRGQQRGDRRRPEPAGADEEVSVDLDSSVPDEPPVAEAHAAQLAASQLANVQAQAEARLAAELERVRREAAEERTTELAHLQAEADAQLRAEVAQVRTAAAADARDALTAELANAHREAEARLASEVALVRAEAERRRLDELAEVRAQLDEVRATAREQPRAVAAGSVSVEVARAESTTARVARQVIGRLPSYTLPAVAALLLVAGGLAFIDVSSLTGRGASLARSASRTSATTLGHAVQAAQAVLKSDEAPRVLPRPTPTVVETPLPQKTALEPSPAGLLAVLSRVPLELYVSGRRIGTTDEGQIVMAPGRYRVGLVSTPLNYRSEVTLDVRSGAITSHNVSLPDGLLQLDTEPGAEVWVEGERAGIAPLDALPVPIGAREVVVKHADFGERRAFVEVRHGGVTSMNVPLREVLVPPEEAFPLPSLAPRIP